MVGGTFEERRGGEEAGGRSGNQGADDEAVNQVVNDGRDLGGHAPAVFAQMMREAVRERLAHRQLDNDDAREKEKEEKSKAEKERQRKGKGIAVQDAGQVQGVRSHPSPISSGSGSHDPNEPGMQLGQEPLSSSDADSNTGPAVFLGKEKDKPIVISDDSNQEDMDLGGDGGHEGERDQAFAEVEVKKEAHLSETKMVQQSEEGGDGKKEREGG